jgi:hypothetical protein
MDRGAERLAFGMVKAVVLDYAPENNVRRLAAWLGVRAARATVYPKIKNRVLAHIVSKAGQCG